ncbi:GNAT family N-acetyltransferase [Nocardia puris]|uniref:GNAT family N-acetyltransferase n=1 Tax=Nocardia puris TaxID=208602 RepID=UPI00189303C0|nr:GNAT family N-acetyltransferase [Nocardia puris]MBF6212058.1 GNAT family N-acetyltransferase [Nocardia puris]MBF6367084.1 GNAT family N-acetyltransferase [Nocardia puris]MBF6461939.1 GNAT family N-acetyltransferase [Nocardia puris]
MTSATPPTRPPLIVSAVDWEHPDAVTLRGEMAAEVGPRYADLVASGRTAANSVDPQTVHRTFVVYSGEPAGHAAVRWNEGELEVKRMFVRPAYRGSGAATALLTAAEDVARELGLPRLILQTGHLQPDAVRFYERSGYHRIPIFAPYHVLPLSKCYAKQLQ